MFGVCVGRRKLGSFSGKGEVCEELRKLMIDVCCLQEVRWIGQDVRMLEMEARGYKLWVWKRRWGWWCMSYDECGTL